MPATSRRPPCAAPICYPACVATPGTDTGSFVHTCTPVGAAGTCFRTALLVRVPATGARHDAAPSEGQAGTGAGAGATAATAEGQTGAGGRALLEGPPRAAGCPSALLLGFNRCGAATTGGPAPAAAPATGLTHVRCLRRCHDVVSWPGARLLRGKGQGRKAPPTCGVSLVRFLPTVVSSVLPRLMFGCLLHHRASVPPPPV